MPKPEAGFESESGTRSAESIAEKVAKIARLDLTDAEKSMFEKDMQDILKAFGSLDKAKTEGVEPAFQPIETSNVLREDIPENSLPLECALSNTPHKEGGFFKGPKAL